jgi:hypothetical protein
MCITNQVASHRLGTNTPHHSNSMHVLHLTVYNPDLMTIRPSAQTVKLTEDIHASHNLIDNVSPHAIVLRTAAAWQRCSAWIGVRYALGSV